MVIFLGETSYTNDGLMQGDFWMNGN